MPYDETTADRVRHALSPRAFTEKRTIGGGLTFMLNGHMCCSVRNSTLMVRVGPQAYLQALGLPHTSPLEFAGRKPLGYVRIDPEGFTSERALRAWIQRGIDFVSTLPAKKVPAKKAAPKKRT